MAGEVLLAFPGVSSYMFTSIYSLCVRNMTVFMKSLNT